MSGVEGAASPFEWIVSRICEEFHCRPTEAMQELRDDRWRLTFAILEMRAYAHAKHRLDTAKPGDVLDEVPLMDEVLDNEIALATQIFDEDEDDDEDE